jgi:hypothetical protein
MIDLVTREMLDAGFRHADYADLEHLGEVYHAMLAAAWRPIETAPKDGTRVLLGSPEMDAEIAGWAPHTGDKQGRGAWDRGDGSWVYNPDPTHWMPLPPRPGALPSPG